MNPASLEPLARDRLDDLHREAANRAVANALRSGRRASTTGRQGHERRRTIRPGSFILALFGRARHLSRSRA
jgi:hypothetical protein